MSGMWISMGLLKCTITQKHLCFEKTLGFHRALLWSTCSLYVGIFR